MLKISGEHAVKQSYLEPSEPLWKRAPGRDENGKPVCDFRMLIKGLKHRPRQEIELRLKHIQAILTRYQQHIVFADLNMNINLLWISVRPGSRIDLDIAAEIHHAIPEAKLIADYSPGR